MNESNEILLNESKSKMSVNSDILLNIELNATEKKLPPNEVDSNIDQYKEYIKEKDASNKYRFVFTINPICTNVLYNHITEIIDETGDNTIFYGRGGKKITTQNNKYVGYKYKDKNSSRPEIILNRAGLITDTGYSHSKCGNFTYHCGIDIFNNHLFRSREFVIVSKKASGACPEFNTISDKVREWNGTNVKGLATKNESPDSHLYYRDTFKSFNESLRTNLIEKDGWFGFINKTGIDINNFVYNGSSGAINKVINNRKACEFIDLYPDRTLFSFIPKKNEKLHRDEFNWDYCLTYPCENYEQNKLVSLLDDNNQTILNGLLGYFCDKHGNRLTNSDINENLLKISEKSEFEDIIIRTSIRNNIKTGDYIKIHLVANKTSYYTIRTNIKVRNVGIGGYNKMYYFTVNKSDLLSGLKTMQNLYARIVNLKNLRCYIQRISEGRPCKYYFRKFKRIPNFKNTDIYNINGLNYDAINKCCLNNFNSSLNKLGFGTNIYGDRMAQIVFNDDVDVTNIPDNLGRPLHEIYLTIIKANRGNKLWYAEKKYSDTNIECSHCFGDVTSGVDMPWGYDPTTNDDYNVHKIHNIDYSEEINPRFPDSVTPLEETITSGGSKTFSSGGIKGEFLGDIVELDELNVNEVVLEDIYHRFNTMQREFKGNLEHTSNKGQQKESFYEFADMFHDEIIKDDYDGDFTVETSNVLDDYFMNLAAEGYYYKAHYKIPIREFSDVVNEGQHRFIKFDEINSNLSLHRGSGITDKNYYFQSGDTFYVYYTGEYGKKEKKVATVTDVSGDDFRNISFSIFLTINDSNKDNFIFLKPNSLMPPTAYDFDDGSGIYRWKDIESFEFITQDSELYDSVFTNGAHYLHKNINFFLRRQDPYGIYGLNPVYNDSFPYEYQILEQAGNEKDVTPAEHFIEGDIRLC